MHMTMTLAALPATRMDVWLGGAVLFPAQTRVARTAAPARAERDPAAEDADRALVRGMAAGDEVALGRLYDRWQPALFALALRMLRDPDEAAEVVEDTFWQAWRQSARYAGERGAVGSWLTIIARSRALDRLRARGRRVAAHTAAAQGEQWGSGSGDPLAGVEAEQRAATVRQALDALPAEQRRTLEMAYFGGMSQSEIAEATGEPLGTVKTRTRLGLQRLRSLLQERG